MDIAMGLNFARNRKNLTLTEITASLWTSGSLDLPEMPGKASRQFSTLESTVNLFGMAPTKQHQHGC
jgi:hypothetical protein